MPSDVLCVLAGGWSHVLEGCSFGRGPTVQAAVRTEILGVAEAAGAVPAMLREGARGYHALASLLRAARCRQRGE
eukprot:5413504-Pyramimonas_sp.AAC.1